jgi:hypothetical protein
LPYPTSLSHFVIYCCQVVFEVELIKEMELEIKYREDNADVNESDALRKAGRR